MITNPNHRKFQFLSEGVIKLPGVAELSYVEPQQVDIVFRPEATQPQKDAINAFVAGFNWSDAAQIIREQAKIQDREDLRTNAQQAVSDLDAFLAVANPSNAQILAAVRRLCQIDKQLIKRLIQID